MLTRIVRSLAALALLAGAMTVAPLAAQPAFADCSGSGQVDNNGNVIGGGECHEGGGGDTSTGGGGGGGTRTCEYDGEEIPCVTDQGVFVEGCYRKLLDPQPAKSEPIWNGHDDGYIISCIPPKEQCTDDMPTEHMYVCAGGPMWQEDPPPTDAGPSPRELAEEAYARMHLDMGGIGSTPPSTQTDAGSVGMVGVPVWLWVTNPGEGTTQDTTETATDGDLTVTVTGTLDRIDWTLADDSGVYASTTCRGAGIAGTRWTEADGATPSPTCGFGAGANSRAGKVTVTGTAYWNVTWAGGGAGGTFDVPAQSSTAALTIGEVQVLTQ